MPKEDILDKSSSDTADGLENEVISGFDRELEKLMGSIVAVLVG